MTFKELKDAINRMDEIQLLQLVMVHVADGEYECDLTVKYNGRGLFVIRYEGDDDGSEMAAS